MSRPQHSGPVLTPHREDTREKVPYFQPFVRGSEMNTREKQCEGQVLGRDLTEQ